MESLQTAGESVEEVSAGRNNLSFSGGAVGRWFGVARDDEMETAGWRRTGTLPLSSAVRSYTVLPQGDPDSATEAEGGGGRGTVELGNRDREAATEAASQRPQRRGGRGRRGMDRVAATLTLRRRRKATSREEVRQTLPKFWPVATFLVVLAELALLVALLVQNGFAPIAFEPRVVNDVIEGFGNYSEFVTREDVPNFFIGPSSSSLIHAGAKYTPVSAFCILLWGNAIVLLSLLELSLVLSHTHSV